jgi:hypothetical protein
VPAPQPTQLVVLVIAEYRPAAQAAHVVAPELLA